MTWTVVDTRNKECLFQSTDKQKCIDFLESIWEESSTDYIYSIIEKVKKSST
jgi:hypothetical protein